MGVQVPWVSKVDHTVMTRAFMARKFDSIRTSLQAVEEGVDDSREDVDNDPWLRLETALLPRPSAKVLPPIEVLSDELLESTVRRLGGRFDALPGWRKVTPAAMAATSIGVVPF